MKPIHILVFLLCLAGSNAWLTLAVDRGPLDRGTLGREQLFWSIASSLHEGRIDAGALSASREPVYPRLLTALAGMSITQGHRVQRAVLLTIAAVLLLILLLRIGVAPLPAAVGSLLPFFAAPLVSGATLFSPGMPAALLLLGAGLLLENRFGWAGAAALTALSLWTGTLLSWVALILFFVALTRLRKDRSRWIALLFLGASLGIAFGLGRAMDSVRPLPTPSGIEAYQGHRPASRGGLPVVTDRDADRFWTGAEFEAHGSRLAGKALATDQLGRFWAGRAFSDGLRHLPGELLRTVRKFWAVLSPLPFSEPVSSAFTARLADRPGYSIALWIGRLLLPLGWIGWVWGRRRVPPEISLLVLSGFAASWLSFAREDLRMLTLLLISAGVALFLDELRRAAKTKVLAMGLSAVLVLGLLPFFLQGKSNQARAMDSYWLGVTYAHEKRGSAALREFDRSVALDPDSPLPPLAVADLLIQDQVLEEAIRELEKVREEFPNLLTPLFSLARLYETRERWSEAVVIRQALIHMNPYSANFHNNLGTTFLAAGFMARAEAEFRKALELDPHNAAAGTNLSRMQGVGYATRDTGQDLGPYKVMALLREGKLQEAEAVLARSYAQPQADTTQLRFMEGILHFQRQEYTQAISLFDSLIPVFGSRPMFRHNLAAAYAAVGRTEEAVAIWIELVRKNPGNQVFKTSLAQSETQLVAAASRARDAEARTRWTALVRLFPHKTAYAESLKAAGP